LFAKEIKETLGGQSVDQHSSRFVSTRFSQGDDQRPDAMLDVVGTTQAGEGDVVGGAGSEFCGLPVLACVP
jgi:hypothetical protein